MSSLVTHSLELISGDPFNQRYLQLLRDDLRQAEWIRFSVCYFSFYGYEALSPYLARAMKHECSRALVTLTCSCGVEGLQALWEEAGEPRGRFRCFLSVTRDGPAEAKLLHSKMAVLVKPGPTQASAKRVVLYTGSHNWTAPGLRLSGVPAHCLNVESSIRLEADWHPDWLPGAGGAASSPRHNPVVDALEHMETCHSLDSSTALGDPKAQEDIDQWLQDKCRKRRTEDNPGSTSLIVTSGLLSGTVNASSAKRGSRVSRGSRGTIPREGETLFVQHFHVQGAEPDVFDSSATWAVFFWKTTQDLREGRQPWLLLCRPRQLGQDDIGDPTLGRAGWLVYDPGHNSVKPSKKKTELPPPIQTTVKRRGGAPGDKLEVEHWCIAPIKRGVGTDELSFRPPDRYALLQVVTVRAPEDEESIDTAERWSPGALTFHRGRNRVSKRGFVVHDRQGMPSEHRARSMREEQERLFSVRVKPGTGPTGDPRLLDCTVYECAAPMNRLIFADTGLATVMAHGTSGERRVHLDVDLEPTAERQLIERLQRLTAPGVPHLMASLHLDEELLELLGWKVK